MPIFIKVYSHIQDKLSDPKSKPSLIRNINANMEYLAKRFGITTLNTIITGNERADSLASAMASTSKAWGLPTIPTGTPDYNIIQNNKLLEGSISCILKNLHKVDIHRKRLTYTKKEHFNFKEFDIQLSNVHLTDNNPDSNTTFNHTLKIRNQALFLPARYSPNRPSNKDIENSTANLKKLAYQVNMPTAICELCNTGEICDYFHLFTCPGLESTSQEITNAVLSTIHKATGNPTIQPYFWCTKVKNRLQPTTQPPPPPPINLCKCNLPKHGEYIKCADCKNSFHPHCLGISISIEQLADRPKPFQCQDCNPKRTYFFKEKRDWVPGKKGKRSHREDRKHKIHEEVLITHGLKITSVTNRRKFHMAAINPPPKPAPDSPEISSFKRANLGYIPNHLVEVSLTSAKRLDKNLRATKEALVLANTTLIEGGMKLYKEWLSKNRTLRKEEGTNSRMIQFTPKPICNAGRSINEWASRALKLHGSKTTT
jgi:hypothetical protein